MSSPLARTPTLLGSNPIGRQVSGRGVKPCGEHHVARKPRGLPRESGEDLLGNVRSAMHVAAESSASGGIYQVEMTLHQVAKSVLVLGVRITPEQLAIRQ